MLLLEASDTKPRPALYSHLDEIVEVARKKWEIPGIAVAVIENGEITYTKGYGYRDLAQKKPVTPDTAFQIGSISKSFTATLTAMMIDQKKCDWKTPVQTLLPNFVLHDPWVTKNFCVEDLFAQKSGLPEKTGDMQALLGYSNDQIIYNLRFIPVKSFRARYGYQNAFFLVGQKLLEKQTKQPLSQLLEEKIFTPLGMDNTVTSIEKYFEKDNRASFYAVVNGAVVHIPDSAPFLSKVNAYLPAGGIHSTAVDVAKWLQFHMNDGSINGKQLIDKKQIQKLRRPQIYAGNIQNQPSYYGLGWLCTEYSPEPFVWHNGETFGVKSMAAFIPGKKLGIVVLSNLRGTKAPEAIARDFLDTYCGKKSTWNEYLQKQITQQTKPATPATLEQPLSSFSEYLGTYEHKIYGKARVFQYKNQLVLQLGPEQSRLLLYPQARDLFSVFWVAGGLKPNGIQFFRNQQGKVHKMTFDLFSEEACADFERLSDDKPKVFGYL